MSGWGKANGVKDDFIVSIPLYTILSLRVELSTNTS